MKFSQAFLRYFLVRFLITLSLVLSGSCFGESGESCAEQGFIMNTDGLCVLGVSCPEGEVASADGCIKTTEACDDGACVRFEDNSTITVPETPVVIISERDSNPAPPSTTTTTTTPKPVTPVKQARAKTSAASTPPSTPPSEPAEAPADAEAPAEDAPKVEAGGSPTPEPTAEVAPEPEAEVSKDTLARLTASDDEVANPEFHKVEGTLTRTASSEISALRKAEGQKVNIPPACDEIFKRSKDAETGLDIVRNHISGDDLADPSSCSDSSIGSKDFYTAKGPKYNEKNLCGHMIYTYCPTFYSVYKGCNSAFSDWDDDQLPSTGVENFKDVNQEEFKVNAVCPDVAAAKTPPNENTLAKCKEECEDRVLNKLAFLGDESSIKSMLNASGVYSRENLGTKLEHLINGGGLKACITAMYKATVPLDAEEGKGEISLDDQGDRRMTLDTAEVAHCESYHAMAKFGTDDFTNEVGDNEKISLDGKFRCVRPTAWTVDYESCKTLINTYDGAMATEQIGGVALQAADMVKQNEIQTEVMQKQAEGEGQTAAMDAMQQTAEYKSKQELGKSVFYGAQVATFTTMLGTYTTPSRIADQCNGGYWCARATGVYMPMFDSLKTEFFANQEVKNKFYQYIIETSGKAAVAGILAANYKKQAEMVGEVKENYVLPEYGNNGPRIQMSYCQFNPTAKGCRGSGERFKNGGGYEFGGFNGVGNTGDDLSVGGAEVADGIGEDKAMSAAERKKLDDLTKLMGEGGGAKVKSGFEAPGAAKVTAGGGGSAVNAGGASASGGGGGGGGAGGGVNTAGKSNMAARTGNVTFGQGGGLTFRGGKGGSSQAKDKKSANPFSSLFGKDSKSREVASGANDIAPQNSSLFDKISKRYGIVKEEKRIHNYDK